MREIWSLRLVRKNPNHMIKVNLGCGKHKIRGYVGVDINPDLNPDVTDDATHYLSTLADASVSTVILGHVVQCFKYEDLHNLFMEIVRVVAPSSRLFITIPDIKKAIKAFELGLMTPHHLDMIFLGQRYNAHTISWTIWTDVRLMDTMLLYNMVPIKKHARHPLLYARVNWQTCVEFRFEPNKERREALIRKTLGKNIIIKS